MPADAFKTRKGQPAIEIPGVGIVDDNDGVPLKRAAAVMHELQDNDGKPLTGAALVSAAKEWADRVGLVVGKGSSDDADETTSAATAAETKE